MIEIIPDILSERSNTRLLTLSEISVVQPSLADSWKYAGSRLSFYPPSMPHSSPLKPLSPTSHGALLMPLGCHSGNPSAE